MIWRCAGDFYNVLLKFEMAATYQLKFFRGRKNSKNLFGHFSPNFNITFPATWGCASDFLQMLPNFKIAARGQLQIFLWAQKLQNLKVGNYSDFTITFPTIWRCATDFFKGVLEIQNGRHG